MRLKKTMTWLRTATLDSPRQPWVGRGLGWRPGWVQAGPGWVEKALFLMKRQGPFVGLNSSEGLGGDKWTVTHVDLGGKAGICWPSGTPLFKSRKQG